MTNKMFNHKKPRKLGIALLLTLMGLSSGACTYDTKTSMEGIGFRASRYEDLSMMRNFRKCRDEGITLDRQARASGTGGAYLSSARILESCETEIGPDSNGIGKDERMRAYAVSILNYFKGGQIEKSRKNLKKFKKKFSENDFYYPDGSSFILTMEALLGKKDSLSFGQFSALNVSQDLKGEMRRILYWRNK